MSDTSSVDTAKRRPYSSAITHLTPVIALALLAVQALSTLAPRGSLAETAIATLPTVASAAIVSAWLRHGLRPCPRCIAVRGVGKSGADTAAIFLRLFHRSALLMTGAALSLVTGLALTVWMGLSGHEQHALWPVMIGAVLCDALMATLAYCALCHIAFKPWCTLPHAEPRNA